MKRILLFTTPIILLIMYGMGCSKDHEAPNNSKYSALAAPTDLMATYNVDTGEIDVTWDMDDVSSVVDYYIGISDSSLFDEGNMIEFFTNIRGDDIQNRPYSESFKVNRCLPGAVADQDSVILYFKISAVFNNDEFNNFIGPRSDTDSTLVRQE